MTILTMEGGQLVANRMANGHRVNQTVIRDMADYQAVIVLSQTADDGMVMASSSCDFPEEYTSDPAVIALCREIRGLA